MTAQLQGLTAYGRRNRRMIWGLIISLLMDVALTVVIATVAVQAHDANATAVSAQDAQAALCQAGNTARAQQIQLWTFVLDLSAEGAPPQSAQQKKRTEEFRAYLGTVFAPRNCSAPGNGSR